MQNFVPFYGKQIHCVLWFLRESVTAHLHFPPFISSHPHAKIIFRIIDLGHYKTVVLFEQNLLPRAWLLWAFFFFFFPFSGSCHLSLNQLARAWARTSASLRAASGKDYRQNSSLPYCYTWEAVPCLCPWSRWQEGSCKTVLDGPECLGLSHLPLQTGLEGVAMAKAPGIFLLWIVLLTYSVSASFNMLRGKGFSFWHCRKNN